jgi:hypothetical protein
VPRPRLVGAILACVVLAALPAAAQVGQPGEPGPFVVDLRGVTAGLPSNVAYYPAMPESTSVPTRGFGGEVGTHVYLFDLGVARIGAGVSVLYTRGTATTTVESEAASSSAETAATLILVAPQLSLNFGTRDGWSYVSGGLGTGELRTRVAGDGAGSVSRTNGWVMGLNVGGGARWFVSPRLAVGFDLRVHRLARGADSVSGAAAPALILTSVAAGISIR